MSQLWLFWHIFISVVFVCVPSRVLPCNYPLFNYHDWCFYLFRNNNNRNNNNGNNNYNNLFNILDFVLCPTRFPLLPPQRPPVRFPCLEGRPRQERLRGLQDASGRTPSGQRVLRRVRAGGRPGWRLCEEEDSGQARVSQGAARVGQPEAFQEASDPDLVLKSFQASYQSVNHIPIFYNSNLWIWSKLKRTNNLWIEEDFLRHSSLKYWPGIPVKRAQSLISYNCFCVLLSGEKLVLEFLTVKKA